MTVGVLLSFAFLLLCERKLMYFSKYKIWYEYDVFSSSRQFLILSQWLKVAVVRYGPFVLSVQVTYQALGQLKSSSFQSIVHFVAICIFVINTCMLLFPSDTAKFLPSMNAMMQQHHQVPYFSRSVTKRFCKWSNFPLQFFIHCALI